MYDSGSMYGDQLSSLLFSHAHAASNSTSLLVMFV